MLKTPNYSFQSRVEMKHWGKKKKKKSSDIREVKHFHLSVWNNFCI